VPDGRTLPRTLGGVHVTLDGQDCFPSYVSPAQVNALVPPGLAAGRRTLTIATETGSASIDVLVEPSAPGILTHTWGGKNYAAAMIANQRVFVAPPGMFSGEQSRLARPSDYLSLYTNALGATVGPHPVGEVLQAAFPLNDIESLRVTVGGKVAAVSWAGMTLAGLYQVNIQLPADLEAGDQPVMVEAGGQSSQAGVYLPVEAAP
jgi:uncharacterized protein (TIGR03437 family)